jgi:ATP-dependent DNA helicase RecG
MSLRLPRSEDLHTEFKLWPVHPDDLAAALVAFANTDGGCMFIGVDDHGRAVGVSRGSEVLRTVDNVSRNNVIPALTVAARIWKIARRPIVVVEVHRGDQRPYQTNRGVCFVRTASGRRHASREEMLRMFQRAESLSYDEVLLTRAGTHELDSGALEAFVLAAYGKTTAEFDVPVEKLLANLRLAREGHPTVAGLLLFGRSPQDHLPFAQVNAACLPGLDLADAPVDRKDLTGQLPSMIEAACRFVDLHLTTPHVIRGTDPERRPELPPEAIREAVVNALAHRDYTVPGPCRLLVFADRVEVRSAGRPPNAIDVDSMRLGTHIPRNPILLSHLAKLGFVTALGSGIPRMVRLVRQATGHDIGIEIRSAETIIVLPRPARRSRHAARSRVRSVHRRTPGA